MGSNDGPLYLTGPEGQRVPVTTGRQYIDLKRRGFYPRTTYDITMESWFKAACEPLLYLRMAKPARISHVARFRLSENPLSVLPPTLGPIISGDTRDRVEQGIAEGKRWAELFPGTMIESAKPTEVRLNHEGHVVILTLVAWGDFNGDGVEDMLVYRASHVVEGTLRHYGHVVLTRLGEGERLSVIDVDLYSGEPAASDRGN
jgi:hypothetical protein